MTFAELWVGERFRVLATGMVYCKRTASEYGTGEAEGVAQPGDPVIPHNEDGAARFITVMRGNTPVERLDG